MKSGRAPTANSSIPISSLAVRRMPPTTSLAATIPFMTDVTKFISGCMGMPFYSGST
ncbi:hypothetical protein Fmac_028426 [Flemingia macrophylla]|uniref:Uncharacterized protein n=1 Tax=Flemingia macrophylla TaxID=520843 RepID=A0ABD1L7G2_9FABA